MPTSTVLRSTARLCAAATFVTGSVVLAGGTSAASYEVVPRTPTAPVLRTAGGAAGGAAPTGAVLAADRFERTTSGGLGVADSGHAWTTAGPAGSAQVAAGQARFSLAQPGTQTAAQLGGLASSSTDLRLRMTPGTVPSGGPTYVSVTGRRAPGAGEYRLKLRHGTDRGVQAYLVRTDAAGAETTLAQSAVAGLALGAGEPVEVRLRVDGTAPTTVAASVWRSGTTEPAAWLLQATDATGGLQVPGTVGLLTYVSGQARTLPVGVAFDDLQVTQVAPTAPADTTAPDTALTGGPLQGSVQTSSSSVLSFTATEAGSTFSCRVDAGAWTPCTSGVPFTGLGLGVHVLAVRATDAAGNTDATPVSRTITVVAAAPAQVKPSADNTGVPAGTVLTPYYGDLRLTTPGATYDALDVHGFVTVLAPDVTITRSIIRGGRATGNLGLITNTSNYATNFTITDSELVPEFPSVWLDGLKGWNFTARRVDAHGTVDLAKVYGNNVTIESSWLHDTVYYANDPNQGGSYTHNDGIQVLGGSNLRFTGNWIYGASNAALQVTQTTGSVNASFSANWVDGGNCTVNLQNQPLPTMTGMTLRDNRFGHNTRYTDCAVISQPKVTLQHSGNVWDDTGLPARLRLNG